MNEPRTADFVVVGAGIVGLAVARELKRRHLAHTLTSAGVELLLGHRVGEIDPARGRLRAGGLEVHYGHLFNAAGLHADRVAQACGAGGRYGMLPFKGLYYRLVPDSGVRVS